MIFEVNRKYIIGEMILDINNINEVNIETKDVIAHIGYFYLDNIGRVEIIVKESDDDNEEPHFYIVNQDRTKEYCSICIFKSEYFSGDYRLTEEEKKELDMMIDCPYIESPPPKCIRTMWKTAKMMWLLMHTSDDCEYDNCIKPDYTKLN